jgi:predicted small metal-binding protein
MTMVVPCRRCGAQISGRDEDELLARVQDHIRKVHASQHVPPREHLLAHAQERDDPEG